MTRWVDSLERLASGVLPEAVYRYFRQGSMDGVTAAEAVAAWDELRLVPHVLRDVSTVDPSTTLLGAPLRSPFAIAPTTLQRAAHRDGEVAMARAAAAAGSLMVVSSNAGSGFADIAGTGVTWWLQAYVTADRSRTVPLLEKAVEAGARAVVLTVDTPVVGTKYDGPDGSVWDEVDPGWLRVNFPAGHGHEPGDAKADDLRPDDIGWLRETTGLPVVVKGILRPDDAKVAVDAGAAAVWVSNHGGRQLDYAQATARCLLGVASEVRDRAEVYVDGGIRAGRHALIARALGARGVLLGRLPLYALATGGASSVEQLLRELESELVEAMRLSGVADLAGAAPDLVAGHAGPAAAEDTARSTVVDLPRRPV